MMRKVPIVAMPLFRSLLEASCVSYSRPQEELCLRLKEYNASKYIFLLNSATSSFFITLCSLKKIFGRREVILPAYTASSLMMAIQKAGLRPLLCDISLQDFNMDTSLLSGLVSTDTLCILGVHMFGLMSCGWESVKNTLPDLFIIEDGAQSFGSKSEGIPVGNIGDVSFFSFNRGKNLPTYGGGFISTNNEQVAEEVKKEIVDVGGQSFFYKLASPLKVLLLALAVRPYLYGALHFFISAFQEQAPKTDFPVKKFTDFQANLALSLLKKIEEFSQIRYLNGMKLLEGLKDCDALILPRIAPKTRPAFNRLPILVKEVKAREALQRKLCRAGIEASRMYYQPLHLSFPLEHKRDDFPQANYFAEHLLTLPVHPLLSEKDIATVITVIKETVHLT